jgi:hypothetical protein
LTIAAPNTNSNFTLTLPTETGTIITNSGNQAGSFTTLNTSGAVVFNDAGADVDFRVEGDTDANLLFVDASADNVGIGTSSPARKFSVVGTIASYNSANDSQILMFNNGTTSTISSTYGSTGSYLPLTFITSDTERARITDGGVFLCGYTSPGNTVAGVIGATGYNTKAGQSGSLGGNMFNIEWTGSPILWIDTTNIGQIALTSDYRTKRNIETQAQEALSRIAQLRPVTYQRANYGTLFQEDDEVREGFIAHELAEVIPSAVEGEKDAENQIQSLKLDALCSVMVKAIQELKAELDSAKEANAALEARITAIENGA